MKAVLDEGVPRQLIPALREWNCIVDPFPNEWKGLKNGKLLDRLEQAGFECLITCDKNMRWQQPLQARKVGVLVLPFQKLVLLRQIAGNIAAAVESMTPGMVDEVRGGTR